MSATHQKSSLLFRPPTGTAVAFAIVGVVGIQLYVFFAAVVVIGVVGGRVSKVIAIKKDVVIGVFP